MSEPSLFPNAEVAPSAPLWVDVAVPLPLPEPLVYSVPAEFAAWAQAGARARVRVGKRKVLGLILGTRSEAPEGFKIRPVEEIVDREPLLGPSLLELARFIADYYLAPPGEVLRAVLPQGLPPWGSHRVWLTDAGAIAPAGDPEEEQVVRALRDGGRMSIAELQRRTGARDLAGALERMRQGGRVATGEERRRGARYVTAVELASGELADHLEACGRSPKGRAAVEYLSALGRPATLTEIEAETDASAAVVRRLVSKGILRRFTQVERLAMDRHRLSESDAPRFELRDDQARAVAALTASIEAGEYGAFLLAGVTGSGKTEVYLRAAEAVLEKGQSVILLVPEIALVPALAASARSKFGDRLSILHSALGPNERHQEWERARRGESRVILGPRSAVFAPVEDLGLIVVDEEHDAAYKQDVTPRYNGRDLALVRARASGATALVLSATPSLESRYNIERGRLGHLLLTERAGQGSMPEGILVDLRQEVTRRRPGEVHFSERLNTEIGTALDAGDQIILLRNRRGYSPILLCRACGEDFRCDDCGLPRTYHRQDRALVCHYCGSHRPLPRTCPSCEEGALEPIGAGTERVEEDFVERFPDASVGVLDRDAARRPGGAAAVLERFRSGQTQVLIGTQMVAKGHHFPGVALTAVLSADTYLGFPDFRAVEKTYALLTQLAGRAGRGEKPGRVVIQTYHPEHYAIEAALAHDDAAFAREEMRFRRVFHYPPFTRMVQLLVQDEKRERGRERIEALATRLERHRLAAGVRFAGPAAAPLERLRGKFRFQLLLRHPASKRLRALVREVIAEGPPVNDLTIDVDPYSLL